MANKVIAGTATGATALPVASTIDATNDYIPIYTASATATQAITRNTYLNIASQPLGLTDTQSPTNKTFDNTSVYTTKDGNFTLQNSSSVTKQAKFSLSGITAGQTRTITLPDYNATMASLAGTETLTNKTLTSPTISSPTITNATISADTVTGFSSSTTGTIYGISIASGVFSGNAIIVPNNLIASSGSSWVFQSWSPTWTGLSVGNGTVVAKYTQIGKTVVCHFQLTFGSTTSISGDVGFTIPVTAVSTYGATSQHLAGNLYMNSAGTVYWGVCLIPNTTQCYIEAQSASGSYVALANLSSTVPNTWANTNYFAGTFIYEAA